MTPHLIIGNTLHVVAGFWVRCQAPTGATLRRTARIALGTCGGVPIMFSSAVVQVISRGSACFDQLELRGDKRHGPPVAWSENCDTSSFLFRIVRPRRFDSICCAAGV